MMQPGADISAAIRARTVQGQPALIAYLTAGFPTQEVFRSALTQVLEAADVVEVGVPFSDPMADGTDDPAFEPRCARARHDARVDPRGDPGRPAERAPRRCCS